ncbi:aldehyde dehydrogenase family protein [Streptosporangium sp. G12]
MGATPYDAPARDTDPDAALAVAERLQAGTVWVNEIMHLSPLVPFGGLKQSGIGVESGQAGLLEFTGRQTVTVKR